MSRSALRIDEHKLMLHPQRVADFLAGRPVLPIYAELSLTNRCNLRCRFCALAYRQGKPVDMPLARARKLLAELATSGVRSVCFAGEGEPALYLQLGELLDECARLNLAAALVTNGTVLSDELAGACCRTLRWIKVSLNAIRPETYAAVHQVRDETPDRVLRNLRTLVAARRESGRTMTIGVQTILLPENAAEIITLGAAVRDAGADYFVVKPYTHNRNSGSTGYEQVDYRDFAALAGELVALADGRFQVIYRNNAIRRVIERQRCYGSCHGVNFAAFIYADGGVYSCPSHLGEDDYCFGSVAGQTFAAVWESARRRAVVERLAGDVSQCMHGCRLDAINTWLWEIMHPGPHADFI